MDHTKDTSSLNDCDSTGPIIDDEIDTDPGPKGTKKAPRGTLSGPISRCDVFKDKLWEKIH